MNAQFKLLLGAAIICCAANLVAHPADENPDLTLPESVQQFRHSRFGLFIHWDTARLDCSSVSTSASLDDFSPVKFNAVNWVSLAKSAGARYLVFNANSSDGMPMWASEVAPRSIAKSTAYGLDVVKPLAYESQRQGIQLYVSYIVTADSNDATSESVPVATREITELLNWYGRIGGVRLTGIPDGIYADAARNALFALIRKLQPSALIGSDHSHVQPLADENFRIEFATRDSHDPTPLATASVEYQRLPVEVNQTVNESTTYCNSDRNFRSSKELLHSLIRAAGMDNNLLLHVAALPNGEVQPESAERVLAVGNWLAKYGTSIYSTRGGPADAAPWGVTTHRFNRVYVHVLDSQTTAVTLTLPAPVVAARYIIDEAPAEYVLSGNDITLALRPERPNEMERLIVLWTK